MPLELPLQTAQQALWVWGLALRLVLRRLALLVPVRQEQESLESLVWP